MARRIGHKARRSPVPTIIGAGITEQWYFSHLQSLFNYRMKIRPRFFGQENIHAIAKKIETVVVKDGGIAICVFDADVSTWDDAEKTRLEQLRKMYADNEHVVFCDSLPSIEYWFLLHYANTNRYFGTSKAVMAELTKFQPGFDKAETFLKNPKWVAEMESDGKIQLACERAEAFGMEGESYTNVHKALNRIK
jgi:hypothetical protein